MRDFLYMSFELQKTVDDKAPLGQKSPYPKRYDKNLLFPVMRAKQRQAMKIPAEFRFKGFDVWNAYELFWLNTKGKPVRAVASFIVPAESAYLCESKSVKLYLNSLNHEQFKDADEVQKIIAQDLSEICQEKVQVIIEPESLTKLNTNDLSIYRCLDQLDITIDKYDRNPQFLVADPRKSGEFKVVSHLFKSHCLCTGQPDLGSIFIDYQGPQIDDAGLLAYLVSYRDHVGFSENCIEQIFVDVFERIKPEKLLVFGRFTRRGGIDINPYRSNYDIAFHNERLNYQ